MRMRRCSPPVAIALLTMLSLGASFASAEDIHGTLKEVDPSGHRIIVEPKGSHEPITVQLADDARIQAPEGQSLSLATLKPGAQVTVHDEMLSPGIAVDPPAPQRSILGNFWYNFTHNLFKPLLLFFYLGFLVPIFRVKFEFPYVIYQGITIYLLIAIGWHGGEELSQLSASALGPVIGFMGVGFVLNFFIGVLAYVLLSFMTKMRRVDKATVAGYYGSDSAGTFVTCLGVLATINMKFDAYMPVMLAVMEIPGCLVALYLVSRLRHQGMDPAGTMPDEPGYDPNARPALHVSEMSHGHHEEAVKQEEELALERMDHPESINGGANGTKPKGLLSPQLLHEVFLNPGLYLLFGGIIVGYISGLQGKDVTRVDDNFFVDLFQGILCLFLLEMGMTASRKLRDLKTAGWGFIVYGLLAPNIFATLGILTAHTFAHITGVPFLPGSYVLFAVLCAAASYIAVPAVQRIAIPEASPTLPLAASLGLTFSYNVTVGIPVYIEIARFITKYWPM